VLFILCIKPVEDSVRRMIESGILSFILTVFIYANKSISFSAVPRVTRLNVIAGNGSDHPF